MANGTRTVGAVRDSEIGAVRDVKRKGLLLFPWLLIAALAALLAVIALLIGLGFLVSSLFSGSRHQNHVALPVAKRAALHGGLVGGAQVKPAPAKGSLAAADTFGTVLFAENSDALSANALKVIADAAMAIRTRRPAKVVFSGYTDKIAGQPFNAKLSAQRAAVVLSAVHDAVGPGPTAYSVHALGEKDPIASNSTAAGRQDNRRVTITDD